MGSQSPPAEDIPPPRGTSTDETTRDPRPTEADEGTPDTETIGGPVFRWP